MSRQWTYELYDDGETFAVYDDGNMIAHCLSPEYARIIVVNHDEVVRLRARIAELEAAQAWRPASERPEGGNECRQI